MPRHAVRTTAFGTPREFRIVGVVPDLKHTGPQDRGAPQLYILPDPRGITPKTVALAMVMRVRGGGRISPDRLKQIAESIGPRVLVGRVLSASDLIDQSVERQRHRMLLLTLLGGSGLLLTLVGVFGMTAYAVARRTREIGVRVALGATSMDVLTMMLVDVAKPVAIGIVLGLVGAAFATRIIASFLFQTAPRDPGTFALVALTVAGTACVAAWVPSRRALRVDPVKALRVEVPFMSITPKEPDWWMEDSSSGINVPIGKAGARRLQHMMLGKGTSQHVLVAGKTGSGKSTLLHVLIMQLCVR